jgi:nitroimidazol reductase NimA-like FMN-containing flavoprotein (pyridoxamine 5'-phosphate oxidase superfamily)
VEPRAELVDMPAVYGRPKEKLAWEVVRERLEKELHYYVASVRPDGRPHVVPKDGAWLDDTLYYSGADDTVHHRNIAGHPEVAMHIGGGLQAVIVEGESRPVEVDQELAQRLSAESEKYRPLGYTMKAEDYRSGSVLALRPHRVIAWMNFPRDATRFIFG